MIGLMKCAIVTGEWISLGEGRLRMVGIPLFYFLVFVHLCGLFIIVSEDRSCTGKVFIHFGLSESEFVLYISIFLVYLMGHNVQWCIWSPKIPTVKIWDITSAILRRIWSDHTLRPVPEIVKLGFCDVFCFEFITLESDDMLILGFGVYSVI